MDTSLFTEVILASYSDEDLHKFAHCIGLNPSTESHLMFLAEEGITKEMPNYYVLVKPKYSQPYFYNFLTGESSWLHPIVEKYRKIVTIVRSKYNSNENLTKTLSETGSSRESNERKWLSQIVSRNKQANSQSTHMASQYLGTII